MEVRKNPRPDEVRQSAQHVLFVEGQRTSIDHEAMRTFLGEIMQIAPLGPSYHLENAARALHEFHPTYYFLIDRDHHDDARVDASWDRFPDPKTHNLLIWPRRELENYFIIPEYLLRSKHLVVSERELRACILEECQKRLYLDAANQVITECRESFKKKWISHFDKIETCATRESALNALRARPEFARQRDTFAVISSSDALTDRFVAYLNELTGGRDPLEFGHGRWLERLRGKEVMPTVVSRCFKVHDAAGKPLQGRERELQLARELLQRPLDEQPEDLRRLRTLLRERTRGSAPL